MKKILVCLITLSLILSLGSCESAAVNSSKGTDSAAKEDNSSKNATENNTETLDTAAEKTSTAAEEPFHLTIEEARENAKMISGRVFLDPEGNYHCESSGAGMCTKIQQTYGADIQQICTSGYDIRFIDPDGYAHQQMDYTMYDEKVLWWYNDQLSGMASVDHKLLIDERSSWKKNIPDFDDALMMDEDDKEIAVLHQDGTVSLHSIATAGSPSQWNWDIDVSSLTDLVQMNIIAMAKSDGQPVPMVVGLRSNGTMVSSAGYPAELSEWTDIVAYHVEYEGIIALKSDGTMVCCGPYLPAKFEQQHMQEFRRVRYFAAGKNSFSAVSDEGYCCGEIRFGSHVIRPDGTDEYASIPDYKEWMKKK